MRYAATPTGKLRFAAPAPPHKQKGIQPAIKHGNRCLSVRATASTDPSSPGHNEDCLFIEVMRLGMLRQTQTSLSASTSKEALAVIQITSSSADPALVLLPSFSSSQYTAAKTVVSFMLRRPNQSPLAYYAQLKHLSTNTTSSSPGRSATLHTPKPTTCWHAGQNIGTPFPDTTRRPLFAYDPTLDHDFLPDYTLNLFSSGRFLKLPAIYGDAANEGTVFVSRALDMAEMSNNWLHAQFPALNSTQKPTSPATNEPDYATKTGKYWHSAAGAYGELRYICPGLFLSNAYARHGVKSNWNYRYAVLDPGNEKSELGTPHVADFNAIWGAPLGSPPSYKTSNKDMVPLLKQYWIRFIKDSDPNTQRLRGTPRWEEWGVDGYDNGRKRARRRIVSRTEPARGQKWRKLTASSGNGVGV
ncbi:MAG: hypothetical protein Q9166_005708 [cf. Caloplaca sp. 2 TL-2023]